MIPLNQQQTSLRPVFLGAIILIVGFQSMQTRLVADAQSTSAIGPLVSDCPSIPRSLPPEGLPIPASQAELWLKEIEALEVELQACDQAIRPDGEVLLKACRFAIEFRELYTEKDFAKVDRLLNVARQRIAVMNAGQADWSTAEGRQIRGFRSAVDGSVQPIGLELPSMWSQRSERLPLYVWLHGRGDKSTDLHFLCERLDSDGPLLPADAIVLHPFGRQCIGYKSAGETDVMEAIEFVCSNYPIDRQRIVLAGFSMGGAGVWHLAAHYAEHFVAASPGAGFAETARYQNLKPEQYPAEFEQKLWSIYDVPGYTRNLFNLPVIAYSGELDKQIQAAQVMEEAFAAEGRQLPHLIGPGMGHKYHPDTLKELRLRLALASKVGKPTSPEAIYIQTKHLRYASYQWLSIDGQIEPYSDTRATASRQGNGDWNIETTNVSRLIVAVGQGRGTTENFVVDGLPILVSSKGQIHLLRSPSGGWRAVDAFDLLRKQPHLSGPIDDAFIDPFLVVLPSGTCGHAEAQRWVQCELDYFRQRWSMVFRGQLRVKRDIDVTEQDMRDYHLVLWGDPKSNRIIEKLLALKHGSEASKSEVDLPFRWSESQISVGKTRLPADKHVLVAIYPNPLAPSKYMVLNSGPTFRSAHDRTNSLQNPHLPDWAIISLDEAPSAERSGGIAAAGFFDDAWQPQ